MARKSLVVPLSIVAIVFLNFVTSWNFAHAQSTACPAGFHSAAQNEIPGVPAGTCTPDDKSVSQNKLYGGCDYNPYEVLEQKYKGGAPDRCGPRGTQITPQGQNTAGIDAALACRLTKLFKSANDRGCSVKIISAYRSAQQQQCMCGGGSSGCAAAGLSCHQKGLAVDVSSSCVGWLRMAAPQFQLVFPYYGQHIQCSEHPRASTASCNRACNGGVSINPDLSKLPPPSQVPDTYFSPPAQSTPTSGIMNTIRNLFSSPAQPLAQVPIPQYTQSSTPLPTPQSSTETTTVTPSPAPVPGISTNPPTQQSTSSSQQTQNSTATSSNTNTSVNINTNENDAIIKAINDVAKDTMPQDTVVVSTPSQAELNENLKNLQQLNLAAENAIAKTGTNQEPVGGSIPTVPNPYGTATFPPPPNDGSTYSSQQISIISSILERLKSGLVILGQALQPFRGR